MTVTRLEGWCAEAEVRNQMRKTALMVQSVLTQCGFAFDSGARCAVVMWTARDPCQHVISQHLPQSTQCALNT